VGRAANPKDAGSGWGRWVKSEKIAGHLLSCCPEGQGAICAPHQQGALGKWGELKQQSKETVTKLKEISMDCLSDNRLISRIYKENNSAAKYQII
jgi:hypothetical protein